MGYINRTGHLNFGQSEEQTPCCALLNGFVIQMSVIRISYVNVKLIKTNCEQGACAGLSTSKIETNPLNTLQN